MAMSDSLIALRQLQALQSSTPALAEWLADYERSTSDVDDDPMQAVH